MNHDGNDFNAEFIPLYIPKKHYAAHLRLLARQLTVEEAAHGEEKKGVVIDDEEEWTLPDLRKLRPLILRNRTMKAFFELTCAKPDHPVTFVEAANAAHIGPSQGRGDLAGFTRMLNRDFAGKPYPLTCLEDNGRTRYLASPSFAATWKALTEEEHIGVGIL